jgi:hypothetical protein
VRQFIGSFRALPNLRQTSSGRPSAADRQELAAVKQDLDAVELTAPSSRYSILGVIV